MRHGKIFISCFTVFLLLIPVAGLLLTSNDRSEIVETEIPLSFAIESEQEEERISCWKNPDGALYVFLPSYAKLEDLTALPGDAHITIGDVSLTDEIVCDIFELETVYPFSSAADGTVYESVITFVQSGNMPTMYIDVPSGSMEYIHMDKTNEETGVMRLYDPNGKQLLSASLSSVKGRGNTSWGAEKKPYNLTLAEEADLLGMGAASRWVLLAEGSNAVVVRNKIVYDFAKEIGMEYAPDSEWVDLYLNGEYVGLYLLTERNEVHPERVNISPNGSFLISMENQTNMDNQKIPYVALDSTQVLRTRWTSMTDQEIADIWRTLRDSLLAENGIDPDTGRSWMELIDLDSWVKKYLIEEVFANPDGGAVSQYFYLDGADPEKKIFAGPVWDYDFSLGGEDIWLKDYDAFLTMAREYTDDGMYLPWFYEMYQKEAFYQRLVEIYKEEILPQLELLIEEKLDVYSTFIRSASEMDRVRRHWEFAGQQDLQKEFAFIKEFLTKRISFLSDRWIQGTPYHIIQVNSGRYLSGYLAVKDGGVLPEIPAAEDLGGLGWYHADSDTPVDVAKPVHEDMHIYMKKTESSIPMIHYAPLAAMIIILSGVVALSIYRDRKNRGRNHDTAKTA